MKVVRLLFHNRAQMHSVDAMIALSLFILIFLSAVAIWDHNRFSLKQNEERNDLEIISRYALESLAGTTGIPLDWNKKGIDAIGTKSLGLLSKNHMHIDLEKLDCLILNNATSYEDYKKILGIRGAGYEFFLEYTTFNKDFIQGQKKQIGYTGECSSKVKLKRIVPIEQEGYILLDFTGCKI